MATLLVCLTCVERQSHTTASDPVAATETIYADVLDAYGAFSTIDSGLMKSYDGKDRAAWERIYHEKRAALVRALRNCPPMGFPTSDARAVILMRAQSVRFPGGCFDSFSQPANVKRPKPKSRV